MCPARASSILASLPFNLYVFRALDTRFSMCYTRLMTRVPFKSIVILVLASCGGGSVSNAPITCDWTIRWVLPTEDIANNPLPPNSLTEATLYTARIPMVTQSNSMRIEGIPPYILAWSLTEQAGTYYYALTVSNSAGESDLSEEIKKDCPP